MNYQFPVIEHVDQVRAAIKDFPEFILAEREFMLIANYNVNLENTFGDADDPQAQIRRECRGLKFDRETGQVIARPYHKFFNVNERAETAVARLSLDQPHHILEKLDGSMIHAVPVGREFRFCTKMGITDVSMGAEAFVARNPNIYQLVRDLHGLGLTVIFEWCSPQQRIVIDYHHDQLIITAVRENVTGQYWTYDQLLAVGAEYGVPVVGALAGSMSNMESLIEHTRGLENAEGYVVRWANGHMTKIKADHYVLLHRTKDQIRQEKNVIDLIVNEKSDDLKPMLDAVDLENFVRFETEFWQGVAQVCSELESVYRSGDQYENRRDFAVEFVQKQPAHLRPLLYELRNGREVRAVVVNSITTSVGSQARIDAARWLWNGHRWSNATYFEEN